MNRFFKNRYFISYDPKIPYFIIVIYAVLLMFFCAGSSPLIQILSPDSNIFFTMGRAAADGQVLYRDIADHKGFYLFFINWFAALLTPDSMIGLWIVEIIFATLKIIFLYKIAYLFTKKKNISVISAFLFMTVATNYFSWNTGNLGEHYALLFQLISLYYMALYFKGNRQNKTITEHPAIYMFIHGLCATVVLFIQANFIAMWIPFGLGLAVLLFRNRYIKNFFRNLISLISGVILGTLPGLLYGIINNCLEDMYYITFEVNFLYAADGRKGVSILSFLKDFIISPSFIIVILAILGVYTAALYYRNLSFTIIFGGMFLFTLFCMNVSLNANPIYYTMYMPFMFPFLIWTATQITNITKDRLLYLFTAIILCFSVICNLQLIKKVFFIGNSVHAYKSAENMAEYMTNKDSKVLVLGESLYYNATDTLPHIRYFTIFGSSLRYETFPYCIDEQFESLLSVENEYVIVQYKSEGYDFWIHESMDKIMMDTFRDNYNMVYEYMDGGIHAALYQKK